MESANQTHIVLLLAVGMLILLLLAGAVVLFFVVYQRRLLSQQLVLSEMEAGHRQELLHSNLEQVEQERKRIAKDLHDEVGSILSSLKLKLNQLPNGDPGQIRALVEESRSIIDTGINSVRRISHDILPPGLELFGLADVLEELCHQVSTGDTLSATLEADPSLPRLPASKELGLYRVVQELINNTIRHSGATHIQVSLQQTADAVVLRYSDNGTGFDPLLLTNGKGLGLRNIDVRVSQIGGQLHWETQPGAGVKITINTPLS